MPHSTSHDLNNVTWILVVYTLFWVLILSIPLSRVSWEQNPNRISRRGESVWGMMKRIVFPKPHLDAVPNSIVLPNNTSETNLSIP